MTFYDVHAHLLSDKLDTKLDTILQCCNRNNIQVFTIYNPAEEYEKRGTLEELTTNKKAHYLVGIHPLSATRNLNLEYITEVVEANAKKCIGIGEIGLDYSITVKGLTTIKEIKKMQETLFKQQMQIAQDNQKPVIIHSRGAHKKALDIVKYYDAEIILHAFPFSKSNHTEALKEEYNFSISPLVLRNDAIKYRQIIEKTPIEKLLLESDSPHLGTSKGMISVPEDIIDIINVISYLKEIDSDECEKILEQNTKRIFKL